MASHSPFIITELLHDGPDISLYRGRREDDGTPVTIKLLKGARADLQQIERLRHEHRITQDLDVDGVIKVHGVSKLHDGIGLIMEDVGGRPLQRCGVEERLDLGRTLAIGVSLAKTLAALHAHGIIHKDIKPSNILYRADTGRVVLTDFGIAARTSEGSSSPRNPDAIEGTFAYMSPEQTGRTNRPLDYRTDLYSLGVTLYELLSGSLPFPTTDPMELVHSHIARVPRKLHERDKSVPEAVSAVVMKLLEKAAEDRYQSALGLQADLEECLRQWRDKGRIDPFPIGTKDTPGELRVPDKLYQREAEIAAVLAAFDRVFGSRKAAELVLCKGYAGVGKSALVHEVHRSIAARGAAFITATFEKRGQGTPTAPVVSAFRELVRGLLAAPPEGWARKKAEILAAVSLHGRLLADFIPELDLILEHEPSLPEVQPSAAESRFTLVFQRFVRVFTGDPLVLFLDDLQWADPASLALLQSLLTDPEGGRLLVIGAYRDHEIDAGHALPGVLAALQRAGGVRVTEIALGPLDRMNTQRLLADALGGAAPWLLPLAELLYDKTRGNPFFLHQLLHELAADGLLSFDPKAKRWVWDEERIVARKATENVAELMVGKIQRLSPEAQRALMLAACIGITFDLQTLSVIYGKSPVETSLDLWEALREGLAFALDVEPTKASPVSYRFSHDRVLDAADSLLSAEERQALHLQIGRLRRGELGSAPPDKLLFDAVNHCNLGAGGITDPAERKDLARLDLAAGKKAMARAAYGAAAGYLRAATEILPEDSFVDDYALAFEVALARAECEQRSGRAEEAEALFADLDREARSRLDRARIATLRVDLYTALSRFADALVVARRGLSLFGIELPDTPSAKQAAFDAELAELPVNLGERSPEELVSAPILRDPDERAVRDLLVAMHAAAIFADLRLYAFVCALRANHCLKHGRSEVSAFIYASWSALLIVPLHRHAEARGFFRAACALSEEASTGRTHLPIAATAHFFEPLRTGLAYCERAIQAGIETGDLTFAAYAAGVAVACRLGAGDELGLVQKDLDRSLELARRAHDEMLTMAEEVVGRFIQRLRGSAKGLDEEAGEGSDLVRFQHAVASLELAVLFGDDEAAIKAVTRAEKASTRFLSLYPATLIPFYASLARLSLAFAATAEDRAHHNEALERHQQRLAELASFCPENYGYQHLLVAAERARLEDRLIEAAELYDRAIAAAREQQVTHHEALANELAARFYLARGREKFARMYLVDAHRGYLLWGATAKAEELATRHPQLLGAPVEALGHAPGGMTTVKTTNTTGTERLDVAAVIRVGQAIAGEIVLDKLISRVMRSVLENAGAERGLLLLERDGRLMIEARITLDPDALAVGLAIPALESAEIPRSIVQFVERTREPMVLADAARDDRFGADPYIAAHKPRSILCVAMAHQGRLAGLLYLENNVVGDAFTQARVEIAGLLASQAAIAVENALLIADIQRRTDALREANERLQRELVERAALEQELLRVQTPLIPIAEGIMVMPLIGSIDEPRARLVLETALTGAKNGRARFVILDITGVPQVDAQVAATLIRTARALRLLGSQAVITGIRPAVAQALVDLGVSLGQVVTQGTLEGGIAFAQGSLGRAGGSGQGKPRILDPRA